MKHHLKRQLRRLATERPYQIIAGSAAALVLAGGAGATLTATDGAPAQRDTAAVADLGSRLNDAATRSEARVAVPSPSASPSASPKPSPTASPVAKVAAKSADPDTTPKAKPKPPSSKVLDYDYQAQTTYYYCGPAAVRNALSAAGIERSQDTLAVALGTTEMGTNSAEDTTRVLNQQVKGDPYRTRMIAGAATPGQVDRLRADVVNAVSNGRAVVSNIVGDATDTNGGWHSFPGGHYVAVIGYKNDGRTVRIADSADPSLPSYWVATADLANWMATRGYSA
ncbi:C39 family peptidase [Micromonospora sp. WMMD1128]|uniref:C39 family peptidase n=1 Tax=unclassified Micromonospora TaxID=2617518 RepID=UPI00248CA8C0|nr:MULTISPECIES: C39 family peptidase [unclassified Micromonospora]WBB71783.1 C39 family peptidase [Micromonospora sp. WMMD1128]WFE34770.1 C39 family peptidase [Micromonospora sp. WMMD975]